MTDTIEILADTLADLLDEGLTEDQVISKLSEITDVNFEEIVEQFVVAYRCTPAEYIRNLDADKEWEDTVILDEDFDDLLAL